MKSLHVSAIRQLDIRDEPIPECPPDGLLVRSTHSIVNTGTDIRIYRGRTIDGSEPKFPVRAGYCQVGIVESVGPAVESFRPGQRVFVMAPFQEYVAVPATMAIGIPDEISNETAAFTDLLDIGLCAIQRAEPMPGEFLAVIGQGVIGQCAGVCGRALGFRTLAIDLAEDRLAISRKMGANIALNPADPEFLSQIKAFTHGDGVDLVVEAASVWPAIKTAYDIVHPRGRIVVPARHLDKPDFSPIGHPYQRYEIALMTSFSYYRFPGFENCPIDICRWSRRRNFELIWDLVHSGRLKIEPMITHRVSYEELPEVFRDLDQDVRSMVGILVEW